MLNLITGNIYDGEWFEGRINGYGRLEYENGDEYEGTWKVWNFKMVTDI